MAIRHRSHKLRTTPEGALELGVQAVKHARNLVDDVQYYTEDAGRADSEYLFRVLEGVIDAGATVINIPDTTGYTSPAEFGALIRAIFDHVPNIDRAVISVHGHNDLGLAVANSLSAVLNGARQVECTINGLGERAGNASLEEVVMTVRDEAGNGSTCTTTLTLTDDQSPTIQECAILHTSVNMTQGADACLGLIPDMNGEVIITDNMGLSGQLTITQSPVAGTMIPNPGLGEVELIFTISDSDGNTTHCRTDLTMLDVDPPVIIECARDQEVRHAREIRHERVARGVLAQEHRQLHSLRVAERHQLLETDRALQQRVAGADAEVDEALRLVGRACETVDAAS